MFSTVAFCLFGLSFSLSSNGGPKGEKLIEDLVSYSKRGVSLQKYLSFDELVLSRNELMQAERFIQQNQDYRSYHLLFSIKNTSEERYNRIATDVKLRVLSSALSSMICYEDWGRLDPEEPYDGPIAEALVKLGQPGLRYLAPILTDSSPARLSSSEGGALSEHYQFRRKDFAYRYIFLILRRSPKFSADLKERDGAIDTLITELKTAGNNCPGENWNKKKKE